MLLGSWLVGFVETDSVPLGFLSSFLGMTVGMIGGMLAGGEITQWLIEKSLPWARRLFSRSQRGSTAWKSDAVKT